MRSKTTVRTKKSRRAYWVFEGDDESCTLVQAGGRPIILRNRKTVDRFIAEMGMSADWKVKEALDLGLETRGRKAKDDPVLRQAELAWVLMKPVSRPKRFEDQRAFMERFYPPYPKAKGKVVSPVQKRKLVRAFIKKIQRRYQTAQSRNSIDTLLSL